MLDKPLLADPVTEPQAGASKRLEIIDKLRGLVIVLMVLDHVRDFFTREPFSPTDLAHTTVELFATRWVTHLCAPTFVALAGVSIFLQRERGKRGWPLARFLLTRGLWLILLEVTWVSFGFSLHEPFLFLQVIWAIGASFILMAPLVRLPPVAVLAIGLAIVGGHDLLASVDPKTLGAFELPYTLAMHPGRVPDGFLLYPLLPWFGIMACGYGAGALFLMESARRDRWLAGLGVSFLAGFAVLRGLDLYGDPKPWAPGVDAAHTVLAFMNVTKYPPSLCYVLATLGVMLTLAPAIGRLGGLPGRFLLAFGRVPLFVYLLHLYIAHGGAVLVGALQGIPVAAFFSGERNEPLLAAGWGFGLPGVYLAWACVVLALWPLAVWYGGVKARRRDWWLGYL